MKLASSELVCGFDEAGRGPVIGPMVLACVTLDDAGRRKLTELNVRDSKKISPARRLMLEPLIKEHAVEWATVEVKPSDIDSLRKRYSLNVIEANVIGGAITKLRTRPDRIIIDSADTVPEKFKRKIIKRVREINPDYVMPKVVAEHRADDNYIEVGAASVIAKVARDWAIEELKKIHGDFGSGYPADERTKEYINELSRNGEFPHFVRRSWNTVDKRKQSTLDKYFG